MFKRYKQIIISFILGALIFGGLPVMASSGVKAINTYYNNIKIIVDDKEVATDDEPFIYNGKTYVPIRTISESLGLDVKWDNNSNSVQIFKPKIMTVTPEISLIKYSNGDIYLGKTKNGEKHGHGYMLYSFGAEDIANYENDRASGYGVTSWADYDGNNIIMVHYLGDDIPQNADYIQIEPNGDILKLIKMKHADINKANNESEEITIENQIIGYLNENFSSLDTIIGLTNFNFDIDTNNTTSFPWDYWVQVRYEYNFFEGAMWSNKYTDKQKNTLKMELKEHQEKLAKALIKKFPDKKFYGGYYSSYYRYPNLKVDLQTTHYFSWINYESPDYLTKDKYNSTNPSEFRWYDLLDDKLD
ncbi:MAG: stalk domain-containing protein [Burkholderiales bacterium]|nr:stalk domain-containing protein [Burkholderiales bacterium]